ncbi:MAG: nucleotidyltransferase family protein [Actinobacteria bacterium]|nr:nucleotidyltransferase family protein [Actinomycetota bacterium]
MRAVVLVGGFGTRLRPLTLSVPKPMLPVGHAPIIERLVANLVRGGVTNVTLALGFKPDSFLQAFPDGRCAGATLRYAVEPEPLDTAGAIRFAAEEAGIDDTFVVANGDVLTDLDVGAIVRFHTGRRAEATLHVIGVDDPSSFGVVAVDGDGRVERFVEKPPPGTEPSKAPVDRADHLPRSHRRRPAVRDALVRLLDRHGHPRAVPAGQPRSRRGAAAARSVPPGRARRDRRPDGHRHRLDRRRRRHGRPAGAHRALGAARRRPHRGRRSGGRLGRDGPCGRRRQRRTVGDRGRGRGRAG